ncbi:MAG: HNH endonuclease signature motif containing protein [Methylorubrum rhodinum]|uniref:HNH endonuclease n=1 Tax=Methylorubrum rhodinum TaxID=29428 RepID=UPI003BAFFA6F
MARREFSKPVRRQARDRAAGRCEAELPNGERCPCALVAGRFVYDHRVPDAMGGEPTLENCQVICRDCDRAKYPADRKVIDDTRRQRDAHDGIRTAPTRKIAVRPMPKAALRTPATGRVNKLVPVRVRPLYVPGA